jgi:hypothetical protein
MHPVLKAAIENPRMPRPYGFDREDRGWGFDVTCIPVDVYMRKHQHRTGTDFKPANDN